MKLCFSVLFSLHAPMCCVRALVPASFPGRSRISVSLCLGRVYQGPASSSARIKGHVSREGWQKWEKEEQGKTKQRRCRIDG